jgi:hypothetical protein
MHLSRNFHQVLFVQRQLLQPKGAANIVQFGRVAERPPNCGRFDAARCRALNPFTRSRLNYPAS